MRSSTSQGPWVSSKLRSEEEISQKRCIPEVLHWHGEVIFQKKKRFIYKLGFTFIHKCYCASYYGILTNPFLWEIGLEILNNYKYFDLNLKKHCEVWSEDLLAVTATQVTREHNLKPLLGTGTRGNYRFSLFSILLPANMIPLPNCNFTFNIGSA